METSMTDDEDRAIWEKMFPTKEKARSFLTLELQMAYGSVRKALLLADKAELDEAAQTELKHIRGLLEKALLPL